MHRIEKITKVFSITFCIVSTLRFNKMATFGQGLDITSRDIDPTKVNMSSLAAMRAAFPTQDDSTLCRFLLARNNDVSKSSELLSVSYSAF